MPSYRTKAIVIKRRNQGEADRVLTLFSYEHGKISAIAKGSRKQKSKYGGSVELFSESDFVLSTGKTFQIVTEVSPLHHFLSEEKNLEHISDAHFFAELTVKSIVDEQPVASIYNALTFCLSNLGTLNHQILKIYYISQILKVLGTYPELSVCLLCHEKPTGDIKFSHTAGGIFCDECRPVTESLKHTDKETIKLWRFIQEANENEITRLRVDDESADSLARTVEIFLSSTTGRDYLSLSGIKLTK
jgi:DNA repair protein RecO (recombination protein O)